MSILAVDNPSIVTEQVKEVTSERKPFVSSHFEFLLTDDGRRLLLNNTAMISDLDPTSYFNGIKNEFSFEEMYRILSALAHKDILASRILSASENVGKQEMWGMVSCKGIIPRLLNRSMKQDEYLGYLSGHTPLGKIDGKDYVLPVLF